MIILRRRDRLGNCLFQYCFARTLATRFKYKLTATPLPGFPGTAKTIDGDEVLSPLTHWHGQWPRDAFTGAAITSNELRAPPGVRLTLSGWFQRIDLIEEVLEEIRYDWARIEQPYPARDSGDFAICLRLGDYAHIDSVLPRNDELDPFASSIMTEYEVRKLVRNVSHKRLFFVTDNPKHQLIDDLRDLGAEIVAGRAMDNFRFMHSCKKIAISQSTFHWWASFLGASREIYFPNCERGIWSKPDLPPCLGQPIHHGIDLRVKDPRYIYAW